MSLSKTDLMIAAQKIKSLTANLAAQVVIPEVDAQEWVEKIFSVLTDFRSAYGNNYQFVFTFIKDANMADGQSLNLQCLSEFVTKRIECFNIDQSMMISLSELDSSELVDVSSFCHKCGNPSLHISGEEVLLLDTEGRIISFYNYIHPYISTRNRIGKHARNHREYKVLIDEQCTKQLISRMDEIWDDRNTRTLVPKNTEKVFQTLLAKWLAEHIYDGKVISEVGKISGVDRTDIEIIAVGTGDQYIIEVKWLGTNKSNTSYGVDRIKEGVEQVRVYLERDPIPIEGCLVCYDGRSEEEKSVIYTPDNPIARFVCKILWLESKSASQIGGEI